jgi:hypothetical protein
MSRVYGNSIEKRKKMPPPPPPPATSVGMLSIAAQGTRATAASQAIIGSAQ